MMMCDPVVAVNTKQCHVCQNVTLWVIIIM